MRIKLIFRFLKEIGFKWCFYRIFFEIRKKTGFFFFSAFVINNKSKKLPGLHYKSYGLVSELPIVTERIPLENIENISNGRILTFSHSYKDYFNSHRLINWHFQPDTGRNSPRTLNWYEIPDFSKLGDIKLIWEPSRFSFVVHYINAYKSTGDEKYARSLINLIISWIDSNPFPYGANYKCGQEISFRLFAWIIALDHFSKFLTEDEKGKIFKNVYVSLLRINSNIDYAVKSVRNNHSISEASGLFVGGVIFPSFAESHEWRKKGIKLLIQETAYQISDDGSYIQNSMNYHRLVMDVLSFVLLISKKTGFKLPVILIERHQKLYEFLTSFIQTDGRVPNYGSNDGAYLFPLSEYQDFRPSINFAGAVNSGKLLYEEHTEITDFFGIEFRHDNELPKLASQFPASGYFQMMDKNFYCFIRCHTYKTRPAHSDCLHLDIWVNGKNLICDTGSYSYNTDNETKKHFSGIFGHNTVVVDNMDYMLPVLNFGKTNWPRAVAILFDEHRFVGEHYGYKKINGITHRREIELNSGFLTVRDKLSGIKKPTLLVQQWHSEFKFEKKDDNNFTLENIKISSNCIGDVEMSKVSRYYNSFEEASKLMFSITSASDLIMETNFEIL